MPIYSIQGPDGKIYEIEGPAGATKAQVVAAIQAKMQAPTPAPAPLPAITLPPSTQRTTGEAFKDIGASVVGGLGSLLQVPGQLAQLVPGLQGIGQAIAKPGTLLEEAGESLKSQGLKVREALRSQAITEAEKEGILSAFATAITQTVKDPALLSTFISGQLPQLLGPAAAAKVGKAVVLSRSGLEGAELAAQAGKIGTRSAVGAGAAMQGADISSDAYKQALEAAQKQGMSEEDANAAALTAARKAFALAAPISLASQMLPGGSAIERRLAGLPGTGRLKSAAGEALSEAIEEGGGAFATNVGVLGVDPTRSLTQGVGAAAGLGTLGGGVLGGVLGKAPAPELPPELRPGETDRQAAERIQAEILAMKQAANPPAPAPSPILNTNNLYNLIAQPNGYGLVEQYKQRLMALPEQTPEVKQAIEDASFIQRRSVIEAAERRTTKPAPEETVQPKGPDAGEAVTPPSGESIQVAGEPDTGSTTEGVGATQPSGVVPPVEDAGQPAGRAEAQPAAVVEATPPAAPQIDVEAFLKGPEGETQEQRYTRLVGKQIAFSEAAREGLITPEQNAAYKEELDKSRQWYESTQKERAASLSPESQEALRLADELEKVGKTGMVSGIRLVANRNQVTPQNLEFYRDQLSKAQQAKVEPVTTNYGVDAFFATNQKDKDRLTFVRQNAPKEDVDLLDQANQAMLALAKKAQDLGYGLYDAGAPEAVGKLKSQYSVVAGGVSRLLLSRESTLKNYKKADQVRLNKDRIGVLEDIKASNNLVSDTAAEPKKSLVEMRKRYEAARAAPAEAPVETKPEPTELDKEIEAKIEELGRVLSRIMGRFGLKDVALNLVEDMKAEGEYAQSVIRLALDAASPVQALRHESIHALKELGFFTPQQWAALEKQAKSKWVDQYLKNVNINKEPLSPGEKSRYDAYMDLYKGDMDAIIEEAIADAFGDFDVNKAPPGLMQAILTRLRNFFDAVKTAFGGEITAEQVFRKVEKGELGKVTAAGSQSITKESLRVMRGEEVPNLGKKVTVDMVGKYFDDQFVKEFGGKLDYNNPEHFDRAVKQATEEVQYQIKNDKSGLDWYEEDIQKAFKDTAKILPELKKKDNRILFSVIAGIMSPQTIARDNWFIAAKAFEHYVKTGDIPGINPENGNLWMGGTQSANKKVQLEFLDRMVKDLGQTNAIKWMMTPHPVSEINEFRSKYGNIKSGIDGKATDIKPGLYAFGPKIGPFVSNINGIHDVTVDKWFTRTFNRYFGTMIGPDGKIIDAPTEPQRRFIKELANKVAEDAGIKNYQVQSLLWFYEQRLFTELGAQSPSYGFSDGAVKFLESRGKGGGSGVAVSAGPVGGKQPKPSLRGAAWNDERVETLLNKYAYLQNGREKDTKAYAAFVKPEDFLAATTPVSDRERLESEKTPLDVKRLAKEDQEIFLDIKPTEEEGVYQITGHEGRHRMMALRDAGVNSVPVVFYTGGTKNAEIVEEPYFKSQEHRGDKRLIKSQRGFSAMEMIPINWEQRNNIKETFGGEGKVKFSLRSTIPTAARQRIVQTTVARDEKTFYQRIIEAISPNNFQSFRADALNRYDQLSVYDKKLAQKMGGKALLASSSAESAALFSDLGAGLTASALGVHDRMGGVPVYRNGVTIISNKNGTVKGPTAIFAPLARQPGDYQAYQYWAAVKRGLRFIYTIDPKTGQPIEKLITAADGPIADALQKQYLKDFQIDFDAIQKEWIKYNDGLVDYMLATGVLSKERADIYKQYADYLPFYRQMDGVETVGPKIFQSISGIKPPKKLKGGEAPIDDFLENIVRNTQSAIQAGIKNIAAQRAADVATKIDMAERLDYHSTAPNVFHVYENGKPVSYVTQDQLLINAIKSLGLPDLPFIGLFSGPANLLRNLVTKDPGFMLANLMRDSMSAWVTSGVKMTPMVDTITNFGSALAGKSPEFQALMNSGILGGYEFSQNVEASGRQFGKALRKQANVKQPGMKGVLEMGAKPFTSLWEALEKGSTASDAATRMEVYKKTLAETGNEAEALHRALEVMNFNRKGSSAVIRVLTAAVPFLNARMQGLDVLYRAGIGPALKSLKGEPLTDQQKAVMKSFFVRGATLAALSTFYWAMTHDDDEYKKQEQETRDNYWLLPSLGVKIPIPFEIGVLFKVIPERILGYTMGSDTGEDFLKSMARQLTSTLAFNPIPQTVLPVVESMTNFSFFTMRPIVGQGLEGLQPAYQVGPGTSRLAEAIGGATKSLPTELQISPAKLDNLINGYTGTMGMYMVNLMDAIFDMNTDSPKPARRFEQMPLIRRFAIDPEARGSVTAYYELKNSVDSIVRTSNMLERTMNYEELPAYLQDNAKMLATKDYLLDLEKTMKEFREMKILIRSAKMSAEAKGDAISSIDKMENQLTANIQYIKSLAKGG